MCSCCWSALRPSSPTRPRNPPLSLFHGRRRHATAATCQRARRPVSRARAPRNDLSSANLRRVRFTLRGSFSRRAERPVRQQNQQDPPLAEDLAPAPSACARHHGTAGTPGTSHPTAPRASLLTTRAGEATREARPRSDGRGVRDGEGTEEAEEARSGGRCARARAGAIAKEEKAAAATSSAGRAHRCRRRTRRWAGPIERRRSTEACDACPLRHCESDGQCDPCAFGSIHSPG